MYNMTYAPVGLPETPEADIPDTLPESIHTEEGGVTFVEPSSRLRPPETEIDLYKKRAVASKGMLN